MGKQKTNKIEELEKSIEQDKAELKALKEKFTFSGVYSGVAGRKNVLRELKDNTEKSDTAKYEEAIEILETYVTELKENLEALTEQEEE